MGALLGLFSAAEGSGFIATALTALFKGLFDGLFGFLDKKAEDQSHEQLGEQRVLTKVAQENANAERRAAEVATNQPDVDDFLTGLEHGKQF